MLDKYILDKDGKTPIKTCDLEEWGKMLEMQDRVVARSKIGEVMVSTVFLGIDHSFGDAEPPLLFETMIFGGEHDEYQTRCSTWEQAEQMHEAACKLVEQGV